MPSDALHYSFVAKELDCLLSEGKVEKIAMPEKDEIVLTVRSKGRNHSLLISAAASSARCHITGEKKENPVTAPAFLMHLRKHIGGAKILSVSALPFERIIQIKLLTRNELADEEYKMLVAEIMGKYSNIILVNADGTISDCIKKVGADTSSKRQVLPGLKYLPAPAQDKISPTDKDAVIETLMNFGGGNLGSYMIRNIKGLAPISAEEAAYNAVGNTDRGRLSEDEAVRISEELEKLYDENSVKPCVRLFDGKSADFYIRPYKLLEGEYIFFDTLSEAMDEYFRDRDKTNRFNEKSRHLNILLKNAVARTEKKLEGFIEKSESCRDFETDKLCGELILSNIYRIKPGMTTLTAENWYDDNKPVTIALDKDKTPQANAQAYFKRYAKKKKTIRQCEPLKTAAEEELEYFDSILLAFSLCKENSEIDDLTAELEQAGLIKKRIEKKTGSVKRAQSAPLTTQIDGFTVKIGKNNLQNDRLTKSAKADDIWLHTKNIHGSHVVIAADGRKVPDPVILRAAGLAARYSKAAQSQNVPVDYTFVKYVNKPNGAPAGKVVYTHQSTVYVDPAPALE